jgi:hypothetical protein
MKTNKSQWSVKVLSGAAGGLSRNATVNAQVACKADTVEEVRKLIAAAPDLLAALEDLMSDCYHYLPELKGPQDRYKAALKAIAKATGTSEQ